MANNTPSSQTDQKSPWNQSVPVKLEHSLIALLIGSMFLYLIIDNYLPDSEPSSSANKSVSLESQFNHFNGSHFNSVNAIKQSLNDPSSFEHVKTLYNVNPDRTLITVTTTARAKNRFGALVLTKFTTVADYQTGKVIAISEG